MTDVAGIHRHRWRAPSEDGALLAAPPLAEAAEIAAANHAVLHGTSASIDGLPLPELRAFARHEAETISDAYEQSCLGISPAPRRITPEGLWFAAGHQPTLAHAGVWVKNIAASVLAQQFHGVGLNSIVDHDLISTRSLTIPRGTRQEPRMSGLAFDVPDGSRPGEDARVNDVAQFERFGDEVVQAVESDWRYRPMIGDLWSGATEVARRSGRLTDALTRVRVDLERRHEIKNLECPFSKLSQSGSFFRLIRHLARHAERFRECHNRWLAEYRRINRIRSHSHPVADLAREGDWTELPLWVWREGTAQRRRVFARKRGQILELSDEGTPFLEMPGETGASQELTAFSHSLNEAGLRLRPRALMTTLFVRLFLADLFIHGIGGAKYDELTDAIATEFFGLQMPRFLTLTGTFRLPLGEAFPDARESWFVSHQKLRDVRFNAERVTDAANPLLVAEKRRLIVEKGQEQHAQNGARHRRKILAHQLRVVESQLAQDAEHLVPDLQQQLTEAEHRMLAHRVLQNREFAAVLHPLASYGSWVSQVREAATAR